MANPIVTSLPAYVEQNQTPLLGRLLLGGKAAKLFTVQTGCKGPTAINTVEVPVYLADGGNCGWDDAQMVEMTQRTIDAKPYTVNLSFCDQKLIGKYAQNRVRYAAGEEVLPFEEELMGEVLAQTQKSLDGKLWSELNNTLTKDSSVKKVIVGADGAYADIKKVYEAIPADIAFDEDTVILCGPATYREFVNALVEKNFYHYDGKLDEAGIYFPGSTVRVIPWSPMSNTDIVAFNKKEMFYGTDLEGDSEKFDVWYSKDNQEFRIAIKMIAGVNYAFSDHIVFGAAA